MSDGIILPHGGYKKLLTYQKSDIIFQGTVVFVKRFLVCGDRTTKWFKLHEAES